MKRSRNRELWEFESEATSNGAEGRVIVGVDGGATSTVCVCIAVPNTAYFDEPPPVLARAESSGSNHNSVGGDGAKLALEKVLAEALMKAHRCRSAVQAVCLALSGVDNSSDQQCILQWLREIFPGDVSLAVHNDSVAALASGTLGRLHGCVLVAGTGAIAFGVSEDGREARAAGVGPLLGEPGSGYSISQQALIAVMRAHDGRGPPTSLSKAVLQRLELSSPEEIIGWMYKDYSWARVAAIVPTVKACATMGDPVAVKVLANAVEELGISVIAVVRRLNLAGEDGTKPFPLVMVGGVLEVDNGWDLLAQLVEHIKGFYPGVKPIQPKIEPALGAAMLAWCSYSGLTNSLNG
ncbi:hypothetical protein L7F22_031222 [Adiantum nelumboides]|nr:hypothetical protein [Adiantum nelumboides]